MMLVRMIMSQMVLITSFCFEDCITIVASVLQVQMFRFNMSNHIVSEFGHIFTEFAIKHVV